jgi:hypothetical protein
LVLVEPHLLELVQYLELETIQCLRHQLQAPQKAAVVGM